MTAAGATKLIATAGRNISMEKPRYRWYSVLFLLLSGLYDPLEGFVTKIISVFWVPTLPKRGDTPARRRRGLTLILGGIEGPSPYNAKMVLGVLRSRYRGCVVRFDWNTGPLFTRSLNNLMNSKHQTAQSRRVAEYICNYKAAHPHAPVCIIAQSGGAWIAIQALECLPEGVHVHKVVLLAAAVSRRRDIGVALTKCREGIVSIGGGGDFFFLGFGTMCFGTADRVFGRSAGLIGWQNGPANLTQLRWRPEWVRHGFLGNHTSSGAFRFITYVVGPMLPWRCPHIRNSDSISTDSLLTV